jgi:hypothetical protein
MSNTAPMQSTGRRDIHNEPIREGDVVEVYCEHDPGWRNQRGYVCRETYPAWGELWGICMPNTTVHLLETECPVEILGSIYALDGLLKL